MTSSFGELTPGRWRAVKAVFDEAVELPPGDRPRYLDIACANDASLRREVESLLAAAESGSFLATPAAMLAAPDDHVQPSVFAAGQTVGRYRVRALLGAGGMGQVYLAEDPALERSVALKLLPRTLSDENRLARFRQEARAASALSHPNVCVVYEIGAAADGRPYIAMEHVPGESLRQTLDRHRANGTRIPSVTALDIAGQIAAGLAAAHAAGVVHRDLKPENVMVRPDGLVKVLDFGLAKRGPTDSPTSASAMVHTEPGMVLGTVRYMSPEQARGLLVDERTDVWSLGVVLYEMIAGRAPFDGPTPSDVIVGVLGHEPLPLATFAPDAPAALHRVVSDAMRKPMADRLPSMRTFATELEALRRNPLQQDAIAVDPPRAVSAVAVRSESRGRRWPAAAVVAGGVLLAGIAAAYLVLRVRSPDLRANQVTVTTFENASALPALASTGRLLADFFAEGVGAVDSVMVSDRAETLQAEAEATRDITAGVMNLGVARRTHAALLVSGAFYATDDSLQVAVRLVDAATGAIIRALTPVRVTRTDPTRGLAPLRNRVVGAVALLTDPMFGAGMLPVGDPPFHAAYRDVREGLEMQALLRQPDPGEYEGESEMARFARAASTDSSYLQAWLWFASAALRRPGGELQAREALRYVDARTDRLSPFERAMAEALDADARGSHEVSARSWRRAAAAAASWPARWWLGNKLRDANRPREALAVFDSLGKQNPHFRRSEPSIRHYLGDFRGEWAALVAEAARTPSVAQTLDYQQAAFQALAAMDSVGAVLRAVDALTSLPAEGGTSVAYLLSRSAWELDAHGNRDASDRLVQRAVAWCGARTEHDLRNALLRNDCLEAYSAGGRLEIVRPIVEAALVGNPGDIVLMGILGATAATKGDRALAAEMSARVAAQARPDGSRGLPQWIRARIAAALGEREAAVVLLREAFARGATWGARLDLHRDPAFRRLRGYAPFDELMRPRG